MIQTQGSAWADSAPRADSEFGAFEARVDERFRVQWGPRDDDWIDLVLVEATLAPEAFRPPANTAQLFPKLRAEPFSLLFRGDASRRLEQRLYRVVHETLGDYALFLVPVGTDAHGLYYESIFN